MDYFGDIIPRERLLKEVYSKCDIFLYPTFCDSFGYSLIDALVAKLPIVGTNLYAVPEVVEDGKNGFIIDIPGYNIESGMTDYPIEKLSQKENKIFICGLVKSLEKLIKNKKLRDRMGKKSFEMASRGKFSIKERNKKLLAVYNG